MSKTAAASVLDRPSAAWYRMESPLQSLESLAPKPRRFELFRQQQVELPEDSGVYPHARTRRVADLDVL